MRAARAPTGRNGLERKGGSETRRRASRFRAAGSRGGPPAGDVDAVARVTVEVHQRSTNTQDRASPPGPRKDAKYSVCIVGESGVCRTPLAAVLLDRKLDELGIGGVVETRCRCTRDYSVGERACETAIKVLQEQYSASVPGQGATIFDVEKDADADLLLAFDKFVAEDVMREITLMELNRPVDEESAAERTRMLGDFRRDVDGGGEVDDPLYGNAGGEEELGAVREAARQIEEGCEGVAEAIAAALKGGDADRSGLRDRVLSGAADGEDLGKLLPPMLKSR